MRYTARVHWLGVRQHVLRVSALFAVAENVTTGEPFEVSAEMIDRAANLVQGFFLPMADRLFTQSVEPKATPAAALIKHLRRLGKLRINLRDDVQWGPGALFRDAATIAAAMEELKLRVSLPKTRFVRTGDAIRPRLHVRRCLRSGRSGAHPAVCIENFIRID